MREVVSLQSILKLNFFVDPLQRFLSKVNESEIATERFLDFFSEKKVLLAS